MMTAKGMSAQLQLNVCPTVEATNHARKSSIMNTILLIQTKSWPVPSRLLMPLRVVTSKHMHCGIVLKSHKDFALPVNCTVLHTLNYYAN